MADLKISQLTAATTPLAGTEVFPIVQSGSTVKATIANVQAAPIAAQTADRMLFLNGSKVPSTSANATFDGTNLGLGASPTFFGGRLAVGGHIAISAGNSLKLWNAGGSALNTVDSTGVNFTANTPAAGMTSQLLNWYEEGTWTPEYTPASGSFTSISYGFRSGQYTRIGSLVYVSWRMRTSALTVGAASGAVSISGLPFAVSGTSVEFALGVGVDFGVNNAGSGRANASTSTINLLQSLNNTSIVVTDLSTGGANNFTAGFVCYRVA